MLRDALEHVVQISFRVDVVELSCTDQGIEATEDAVMVSEIEQLPDLTGFLKIASQPEWWRVKFERPTQ
jgi:hypothetical protein